MHRQQLLILWVWMLAGDIELVVHYNLPRSIEGFYQASRLLPEYALVAHCT
jgi:hypothetical protein